MHYPIHLKVDHLIDHPSHLLFSGKSYNSPELTHVLYIVHLFYSPSFCLMSTMIHHTYALPSFYSSPNNLFTPLLQTGMEMEKKIEFKKECLIG